MNILIIDNYDSFTWNIYQYFCQMGAKVLVVRNDELTINEIFKIIPEKIVISPGPCTPNKSGISLSVITHYADKLPILGICLGHQAIAQVFGAKIVHSNEIMHGKTSLIFHNKKGIFRNLNNPLTVVRYHSLIVESFTLPKCLEVTAKSKTGEIMGIRHRSLNIEGVQFHPESILSEQGYQLLSNFFFNKS